MANRAEFLESIRHRTRSGKYKPTHAPDVAWTPGTGPRESEAIADAPARFVEELEALGGRAQRVETLEAAREYVVTLAKERDARLLLRWDVEEIRDLDVDGPLSRAGVEVVAWRDDLEDFREVAARADIGLSSAAWAVAETGSLVLESGPGKGRSVTLLPPTYVAVLPAGRVLGTVHEAIERYSRAVPANVVFHTGPSRSGDIEMEIFVGMHGPGDVHVVLVG